MMNDKERREGIAKKKKPSENYYAIFCYRNLGGKKKVPLNSLPCGRIIIKMKGLAIMAFLKTELKRNIETMKISDWLEDWIIEW